MTQSLGGKKFKQNFLFYCIQTIILLKILRMSKKSSTFAADFAESNHK